jgi:prepilin-type N-terminal cleavage/methylation domain-containing protein
MELLRRYSVRLRQGYGGQAGFSFLEIMIAIIIIGILAAVVIPEIQDRSQQAKEAAAKETLQIMRNAIGCYAARHGGIAPGYPGNNPTLFVFEPEFYQRMLRDGYITTRPENPFNHLTTIKMIKNDDPLPAAATGQYGWIYKPLIKTFKIDWPGTDSHGVPYYDY